MTEHTAGYAVFLYDQALEVLGEAVKPYLQDGAGGPHIRCIEVDTAGAFVEMTLPGQDDQGSDTETELMVPTGMVRMIVSTHSDAAFGFAARYLEPGLTALPVVGPAAPAAGTPSTATPHDGANTSADDRRAPPEG